MMEWFTTASSVLAAAEYSLVYLLGGGGLVGAIVVYLVARSLGK
ncbi:MAG: hypothetical protein U0905_02290 [Pirellulales bacterium]